MAAPKVNTQESATAIDNARTVQQLLRHREEFVVPHFQRGRVWGEEAIALLLESLFDRTPCGSIVLWAPDNAKREGVPLGKRPKYLIIDGQQRLRSLFSVFGQDSDDADPVSDFGDPDDEVDAENADVIVETGDWCVNLDKIPGLARDGSNPSRFRLFRRLKSPFAPTEDVPVPLRVERTALVPLRWFLDSSKSEIEAFLSNDQGASALSTAVKRLLGAPSVVAKIRRMLTEERFQVTVLDRTHKLPEVVAVYNRINSAGKRVEAEEKLFASLAAVCPEVNTALERYFELITDITKPKRVQVPSGWLKRDESLERQRETKFGFRLYMRAFVMAFAYHTDRGIGSRTFSFRATRPDRLFEARKELPGMFTAGNQILADVARVLTDKLNCDDFRMLPDTAPLWPLLQLLIRFPSLTSFAPDAVASLAFRLLLTRLRKPRLIALCNEVNMAQSPRDGFAVIDRELGLKAVGKAIRDGVERAESTNSRYTLLMYWLIRKNGGKDFCYKHNAPNLTKTLPRGGSEPAVSAILKPQKQHLVPYTFLRGLFGIEAVGRPGRHEAHDVGNITYISAALNGVIDGVGSHPLKLDIEPDTNLKAHLLSPDLVRLFRRVFANGKGGASRAKTTYAKFCDGRDRLIAAELIEWDQELRREAQATLWPPIPPCRRRLTIEPDDVIRAMQYPERTERALITLCDREAMKMQPNKTGDTAFVYRARTEDGGRKQTARILLKDRTALRLKLRSPIRQAFIGRFKVEFETPKKGASLTVNLETDAEIAEMLDWLSDRLFRTATTT